MSDFKPEPPPDLIIDPALPPLDSGPAGKAYYLKHRPHLPQELVEQLDRYYERIEAWESYQASLEADPNISHDDKLKLALAAIHEITSLCPLWHCGLDCPHAEEEEKQLRSSGIRI